MVPPRVLATERKKGKQFAMTTMTYERLIRNEWDSSNLFVFILPAVPFILAAENAMGVQLKRTDLSYFLELPAFA